MAKRMGIRATNLDKIRHNIKAAQARWQRAVAAALYLEAGNILGMSKRRVPVDLGTLKGSGYATLPVERAGRTTVEIGYGGAAKEYAARVHEDLSARHPDGGQAKYLESAADERTPSIVHNVKALARAAFARGQGPVRGPMPTDPDEGGGG